MSKKILYIGNNLTKKTKYSISITILSNLLKSENFNIKVVSDKQNKVLRLFDMIKSILILGKQIDFILIDTFSTTNFYFVLITSQLARVFKINYIPILRGGNLSFRLKNNIFYSNLIFKNSYKNIAPSNFLKEEFKKYKFNTTFIPNTIPLKKYKFKERNLIQPKLLWVRSFKEIYNPKLAILVLNLVLEKYKNAKLCMIGPNNDKTYLECKKLAEDLKIIDNLEFTGVLTKEEWHKKSEEYDVFINTTNFDNTPVSVIEAMALGLPIVSTNAGGMPYLIDHKIDGVLVNKNNAVEMSNAIIEIIEGKHPELNKSARKKVEQFDWEVVKKQWIEILK
ncbi:glycosyltransferase family 4 protein [Polaribacter haliotis]|uniref:Glycosyltransferase family 4 protein n=1 Tax=Polaribacter haliotis TaxID=1888915 RepID=A0A7L8AHL5_9FLAO|nr:glycosyltransferase family 4 protein [Polaribacter haliotis]QOD61505.1 glycosyltransferase family 4 protein [Polaribacter haliotis]